MGPISGLRVKLQSARVLVPERREAKTGYPLRHAAVHLRSHRHSRHPCGVHHAGRRGVSSMPSFCSHGPPAVVTAVAKLQALVYDILPSTTAVFTYAIGSRKLSANEQFFCWCANSSKFVTNNSDYIRRLFYVTMSLTQAQIKPENRLNRDGTLFLLLVDASHVTCVLGRWVASTVLLVPKPFGGC